MLKFRVTNISEGPRFLTEAGRLLQPGGSVAVNRVDAGTRAQTDVWRIDEGSFSPTAVAAPPPKPKQVDEDEDDQTIKRAIVEPGKGELVDVKRAKRSVPMPAPGAAEPETKAASTASKEDDLGNIPSAIKPGSVADDTSSEKPGFTTRRGLPKDSKDK